MAVPEVGTPFFIENTASLWWVSRPEGPYHKDSRLVIHLKASKGVALFCKMHLSFLLTGSVPGISVPLGLLYCPQRCRGGWVGGFPFL